MEFRHAFFEPGSHTDQFWVKRLPKKLKCELKYNRNGEPPAVGWGIRIEERINTSLFWTLLGSTLILAIAYSVRTHDVSGGFTMASYFASALAVTAALASSQRT